VWHGRTKEIERPPIAEINRIADALAAGGRDLINLGQAILGLPPPESALSRVKAHLENRSVHGYSPDPGLPELRQAKARFLREVKGIASATGGHVMITCGANQAFVNALFTVTVPGDEVIFFGPYYFDHLYAIKLAGCLPVEVPMPLREGRFVLDFDLLEKAVTDRTRAVVLVSPGNPTGAVVSQEQTEQLCRLCGEKGLYLLSDETYDLLTFPPAFHRSPASLDSNDKILVMGSFSKTFGLAGWRVGYLCGSPSLIEETIKVQDTLVVCAPVPSQLAALGALDEVDQYVARAVRELTDRKNALISVLTENPMLDPVEPQGGTSLMARIVDSTDSFVFSKKLVEEAGVVTVPGSAFGPLAEGYVRFSFGNQPVARIREAGERLARL
jgi:aspartate/methionine/tyrosine aminotransferase